MKGELKTAKIVFEDDSVLVLDKNSGVVVNKSATTRDYTSQDDLGRYFGLRDGQLGIGDRAGIVHRLDKETSGLMIVAKSQKAFDFLQEQFKEREVKKTYVALLHGKLAKKSGLINANIGRIGKFGKFGIVKKRDVEQGREAITEFKLRSTYKLSNDKFDELTANLSLTKSRINYLKNHALDFSLVDVFPKTGRTHQIRVHLKSIGSPAVSDLIYCPAKLVKYDLLWCPRLFLHSSEIEFLHPASKKRVKYKSDLPGDLRKVMDHLTPLKNH